MRFILCSEGNCIYTCYDYNPGDFNWDEAKPDDHYHSQTSLDSVGVSYSLSNWVQREHTS